jgi:hypothetical protein
MKHEIGEYIAIYWDDYYDDHPEYVRGHVSMDDAIAAIKKYYGEVKGEFVLKHKYGRWVFSSHEDFDRELKVYDEPSRGAFALTELA